MQLGFSGIETDPLSLDAYQDMRPQWFKHTWDVESGTDWDCDANLEVAEELDAQVVVDVRTRWRLEDKAEAEATYRAYTEPLTAMVRRLKDRVHHWEIWGEWSCPYVAADAFKGKNYTDLLRFSYEVIKAEDPDALVWLGGHGVNFGLRAYQGILRIGYGQYFDVNNLHPFVHERPWGQAERCIHEGFLQAARVDLEYLGERKPIAMTEFGWPSQRRLDGRPLGSYVMPGGVSPLSTEVAAEWWDKSLRMFDKRGVQALMVCSLHDGNRRRHWGGWLGLIDRDGEPKPQYEVVRRWMHKGRESAPNL